MSGDIIELIKYNNQNFNIILLISGILFFYFMYIQEDFFFNKMRDKECKHYKGNCNICKSWHCKKYQIEYERNKN